MICKHARVCITLYTPQTVARSQRSRSLEFLPWSASFPQKNRSRAGGGGGGVWPVMWWKLQKEWHTVWAGSGCSAASYCKTSATETWNCAQLTVIIQITTVEPGQRSGQPMPSLWVEGGGGVGSGDEDIWYRIPQFVSARPPYMYSLVISFSTHTHSAGAGGR